MFSVMIQFYALTGYILSPFMFLVLEFLAFTPSILFCYFFSWFLAVALRNLPEKCHIWGKVQFDVTTALAYFIQKIQQPEMVKPLTNKTCTDTRTHSVT